MRLWLKVLLVLGMTLAILIPLSMIRGVIAERQVHRATAVARIAQSYAGAQSFAGPVLVVPYTQKVEVEEKDAAGLLRKVVRDETRQWTFFPTTLNVTGKLDPDTRKVGLHQVRVYKLHGAASADFDVQVPDDATPAQERRIGKPWLSYAIADVRGLGNPRLTVGGIERQVEQGRGFADGSGLHVTLDVPQPGQRLRVDTHLQFALGGTESLDLVPLGRNNRFAIDSAWPHPRFAGKFLPANPQIGGKGFKARWEVPSLATGAQEQFLRGKALPSADNVGRQEMLGSDVAMASDDIDTVSVALVDPVNVYLQADRASKYGLLFVLLTFVGFFMFELIKQLRIHPIQYGLVGLALSIFFLLLVGLSEHIAFGWSYLIASIACIGLLAFYLSAVLHSVARGVGFAAMLATLYGSLFGLLISEDNALVLGSGLLFLILAALMVVTRKVDWYQLAGQKHELPPPMPAQA